ncbi:autophagy-related protein 22-like protein [Cytidiella melzeri]|nr:autophagy-related protein 22-like protein [Cytidiella melzeri]
MDNGYLPPDTTVPCSSAIPGQSSTGKQHCVVKIAWLWIDSASFSLYVNSISVAMQALTVISMGNIADQPPHHKHLLLSFSFFGATAATLFLLLPSSSPLWPASALLGICANVGFGASIVAMNTYLPNLARHSEEVVKRRAELHEAFVSAGIPRLSADNPPSTGTLVLEAEEPLLSPEVRTGQIDGAGSVSQDHSSPELELLKSAYSTALSRATSQISSQGIALGYVAGVLLLLVALIPVTLLHCTTSALRLAIGLSGICWALFSIPAAAWLPLSTVVVESEWDIQESVSVGHAGSKEWNILREIFTTITSTAILFAKTSLYMPESFLILIGIITPVSGITGSLAWPYVQRRYAWTNLRVFVTLVCMASVAPTYGCLGFLPVFREGKVKF